jgi:hypothetical protein
MAGVSASASPASRSAIYSLLLAGLSGWQYVKALCGGVSFTTLTEGLQEALWQLGGVPKEHRTDRLSPANRNLATEEGEAKGCKAFCQHYRMEPTRNNAGIAHENASVEASHGHLKRTLDEALTLRGSRDFTDLAGYQAFFLRDNRAQERGEAVAIDLAAMGPPPSHRTTDFSVYTVSVTRSGTISVRDVLYTVPSRLVGCRLKVDAYDHRMIYCLGTSPALTAKRCYYRCNGPRREVRRRADNH